MTVGSHVNSFSLSSTGILTSDKDLAAAEAVPPPLLCGPAPSINVAGCSKASFQTTALHRMWSYLGCTPLHPGNFYFTPSGKSSLTTLRLGGVPTLLPLHPALKMLLWQAEVKNDCQDAHPASVHNCIILALRVSGT